MQIRKTALIGIEVTGMFQSSGFIIPIQSIDNIDQDNDFGRLYPKFPDDYIAAPIYSELGSDYSFISATERNISVELKNDIVSKYPGNIFYTPLLLLPNH